MLPQTIFPSDLLDTMDVRYLNYSNAPVISPLKRSLKIERYNDTFFNKQPTLQTVSKDVVCCQLDKLVLQSHTTPKLPSITDIFKEFNTDMTNITPIEVIPHENTECKHADIVASQIEVILH